ncbi:MAG: helix-turn-helix domain-containing protein [Streptosporangiaceae bacterium]
MADFASEVRRLMAERGISLRALARASSYDPSYLSKVLSGHKPVSPYLAARLDDVLGADGQVREAAASAPPGGARHSQAPDPDDINRRELLYLFSVAGALMAAPAAPDWERLDYFASRGSGVDAEALAELAALNTHLWRVFVLSKSKSLVFPIVRDQLGVMTGYLRSPASPAAYQQLCALAGDLFQLAGEILFDGNKYTDAAHCYTLAATASREAGAHDLWACALTRHAFIAVYERAFGNAVPLLEMASALARRGDAALSTRHWVSVVQAHAFAGLGDMSACQAALDAAEQVRALQGELHNGGWLRFDGSRLAEERGACYVELERPDLAESALADALGGKLSARRRGILLTDLAVIGAQRSDPAQVAAHGAVALEVAAQTGSGVIARKLAGLQAHLGPLLADRRVRELDQQITALAASRR